MKRIILFAVLIAATVCNALAYDFSAVSPSGHTLYYAITSSNTVRIVRPEGGCHCIVGDLIIPGNVYYNGNTYHVTEIQGGHYGAFQSDQDMTSVIIPASVITIGMNAFCACSGLSKVVIPNSVTEIGIYAFNNCTGLTSVTIGQSVQTISHLAFWKCSNLDTIRILAATPPSIMSNTFQEANTTATVIVPCNSVASYQNSWGGSFNYQCIPNLLFDISINTNDSRWGIGDYVPLSNSIVAVIANPNYGYHFDHWSYGSTANPDTIRLSSDTVITALFAKSQYTLNTSCNDSTWGSISGHGSYEYLDTVRLSAEAVEHYHFVQWNDGSTDNPRNIIITCDTSLSAIFAIDTHTVRIAASDIARGNVTASGSKFAYGTPCTVEATAYTGYTFAGWSNGVAANPYIFAVMSDVELTALFVTDGEETYTVVVGSADLSMGTASGGGNALSGGQVTLRATANPGYQFDHWNDNNTENPRTVTVTADITYIAFFVPTQGIEETDARSQLIVYPNPTTGLLHINAEKVDKVEVLDLVGRHVAMFANTNTLDLSKLAEGTYTLKVTMPDGVVIRKVVLYN